MGDLELSLTDMPWLADRLAQGQQFNAYQSASDPEDWSVCIGPITNHRQIVRCTTWRIANLLVDALRFAAGQSPQLCRAFDDFDDE